MSTVICAASGPRALADGQHQPREVLLQLRAEPPHHPQVQQRQPAVVGQEDVAGVRVGVEEAVDQDLLEVGAEQLLGQRRAVHLQVASGETS
jgi:hypothetical protein